MCLANGSAVLLCLAVFLQITTARAEEGAATQQKPPLPAGWQIFESAEGRFRVYMPGEPEKTVGERSTAVGSLDETRYEAMEGEAFYLVEVRDMPRIASWLMTDEALIDRSAEGLIDFAEGANVQKKRVTRDGHPALELSLDANYRAGYVERALVILAGRRLYVVIAGAPRDTVDKDLGTFVDSFETLQR